MFVCLPGYVCSACARRIPLGRGNPGGRCLLSLSVSLSLPSRGLSCLWDRPTPAADLSVCCFRRARLRHPGRDHSFVCFLTLYIYVRCFLQGWYSSIALSVPQVCSPLRLPGHFTCIRLLIHARFYRPVRPSDLCSHTKLRCFESLKAWVKGIPTL
jgi:hypothetical protein